jgi:hypothetical protein
MATLSPITKENEFWTGMDHEIEFTTEQDFTAYTLAWHLYALPLRPAGQNTALVSKTTAGGITRNSSTLVTVAIADTDTEKLTGADRANYWHELVRTDDGSEQVLAYGPVVLRQSGGA